MHQNTGEHHRRTDQEIHAPDADRHGLGHHPEGRDDHAEQSVSEGQAVPMAQGMKAEYRGDQHHAVQQQQLSGGQAHHSNPWVESRLRGHHTGK